MPDPASNPPPSPDAAPRPLATVGALVLDPQGRGLFVRTAKWRDTWGVPGGKIEPGEAILDAVLRELFEETALVVRDVRWAPTLEAVRSPAFFTDAHFVLLNMTARTDDPSPLALNDEAQEAGWWPPRDALLHLDLNAPTRALVRHVLAHGAGGPSVTRPDGTAAP
ncbi:MAG: NUDIX domain-containing protein [Trueperaceae bacterium]|nr:NUDIX domain-containing protein [Trueperaceae bacterium]